MATVNPPRVSTALVAPTSAQITAVLPELEQRWSVNALGIQERLREAVERDDARAANSWAIAGGISTEKVLLMKGRPTEIVANLHAHRVDLAPIMDKLAASARVLDQHQRRGYKHVISPHSASQNIVQAAFTQSDDARK